MEHGADLSGLNVLVVEDESLISMMIEDMLAELGCTVVGPAHDLASALDIIGRATLHAAILDVNLGGVASEPIAERLSRSGIPFVFATGYGKAGVKETYRHVATLKKPFTQDLLAQALRGAIVAARTGTPPGG